jgi:deoxyribodipyrimidine photo-lyase
MLKSKGGLPAGKGGREMIQRERLKPLNSRPASGGQYVLYWMQASQREDTNHALEFAIGEANARNLPVLVYFGLTADYPEANLRHYSFMLEGLAETRARLEERGVGMIIRAEPPPAGAVRLSRRAALLVVDRGYLRHQRAWRREAAEWAPCPVIRVETDAVVPVEEALGYEAYSAAVLRPKIQKLLPRYLAPLRKRRVKKRFRAPGLDSLDLVNPSAVLARLPIDRSVGPANGAAGGTSRARRRLAAFLRKGLDRYADDRSNPDLEAGSGLSAYLHFGQISPLAVALAVGRTPHRGSEAFLEQLIVRRELSLNFVYYNSRYDRFEGLPAWSRRTLLAEARKRAKPVYSAAELEAARTHDPYWNAAQREMVCLGRMHGTMRMYWGKKLLEWSSSPEAAFRLALRLNNKYQLDGRDPNGYAGVAWCFGKHDRPWPAQPGFGQVRSMKASGLDRKYNLPAYVRRVERVCAPTAPPSPSSPRRGNR